MSVEAALLESRTLRSGLIHRTDVLDEIKPLVLLPAGRQATTRMVADYFQVAVSAIHGLVARHREELEANGYTVHKPVDNAEGATGLALYSRRTVLCVAMLLRDSEVARAVRERLLEAVEPAPRPEAAPPQVREFRARPWRRWTEPRCEPEGERLLERRLAAQGAELASLGAELRAVRRELAQLREGGAEGGPAHGRSGRPG